MGERVTVRIEDGVADVRLNRPEKLNAVDVAMIRALAETGARLATDETLRAVVLSGEGRAFCAGLDFSSFMEMAQSGSDDASRAAVTELLKPSADSPANFAQRAAWIWQEVPVPVIAAVHGVAFGGGLQIAMGADIRYVAPDARMSVMEVKWGLVPDMSGTQTLRFLLRLDVLKELTFTGRVVEGEEAVAIGLATHLSDDPHWDAMAAARRIAGMSPSTVRAAKRLLNGAVVATPAEGLRREAEIQSSLIGAPDQVEAALANLQNRPPKF